MKKIKSYLKRNYKKLVIQVVSIISALVVFAVPSLASEYALQWRFYDGMGSGSVNPGGIFFRMYNSSGEGKWNYYPTANTFNGKLFRGTWVDPKYTTVAAISYQPVDVQEFQRIFNGGANEKFYIEFPIAVEIGNTNGALIGVSNLYLSSVDFLANEDGDSVKYSVQLDKDAYIYDSDLQSIYFTVGFTIVPSTSFLDISQVSFNFEIPKQSERYYVQFAPNGSIKIKTGEDIPKYAPVSSVTIDKLDSVEQELQDKTQAGVDEADKIFKNSGNIFSKTNVVGTSVMAATKIFNALLKTDVFNDILNVALVLGIFAFLLGLGGVGVSLWGKYQESQFDKDVSSMSDDEWKLRQ